MKIKEIFHCIWDISFLLSFFPYIIQWQENCLIVRLLLTNLFLYFYICPIVSLYFNNLVENKYNNIHI